MTGWSDGLGPWTPVLRDGRLYGRGGADDGYSAFASLAALQALRAQTRAARPLRGADRGLRGERQRRPARLHRRARRPHRHAEPGRLPRLRLRQLRAALDAPPRCAASSAATLTRRACCARACTPAPRAASCPRASASRAQLLGRMEDERTGAILPRALHVDDSRRARRAGRGGRRGARARACTRRFRSCAGGAPVSDDVDRAAAQPHLAPAARGHRRRRAAGAGAAPATCCAPQTALKLSLRLPPTARRGAGADACCSDAARRPTRPTAREVTLRRRARRDGLERAAAGAVARGSVDARLARLLRPRRCLHGRGRHHPVHGHARASISRAPSS